MGMARFICSILPKRCETEMGALLGHFYFLRLNPTCLEFCKSLDQILLESELVEGKNKFSDFSLWWIRWAFLKHRGGVFRFKMLFRGLNFWEQSSKVSVKFSINCMTGHDFFPLNKRGLRLVAYIEFFIIT